MKNLAIDTTSNICSVAILENDKVIDEINLDNGRTHSENFMPIIEEILKRNNIKLSEIELISCAVGPGSFTGIRIGIASIKAMAEVYNIPIVEVTSLEILARIDESEKNKVALIDARNNQVYCGIFDCNYDKKEEYIADDISIVMDNIKKYDNLIFIGNGAILHKDLINEKIKNVLFAKQNLQYAKYCGMIGYKKFLNGEIKNADELLPLYLRKSQAERMKKDN